MTADGHGVSFWGDGVLWDWTVVVVDDVMHVLNLMFCIFYHIRKPQTTGSGTLWRSQGQLPTPQGTGRAPAQQTHAPPMAHGEDICYPPLTTEDVSLQLHQPQSLAFIEASRGPGPTRGDGRRFLPKIRRLSGCCFRELAKFQGSEHQGAGADLGGAEHTASAEGSPQPCLEFQEGRRASRHRRMPGPARPP